MLPGFAVDPDQLVARVRSLHRPIATFCLFSGGNDSTVLAHRMRHTYDGLAWVDTGTALPGVEEFVVAYAGWLGKPLTVLRHEGDPYRRIVLGGERPGGKVTQPLGFPGPMQHTRCYVDLKERLIERLVREAKEGHPRTARVMLLTGVRRGESQRRKGRAPITRRGSKVFVNPLTDWSDDQVRAYRSDHALPQSDVAALLHRSGECNCGAYATPDERADLQALYPDWWEQRIAPLEAAAEAAGLPSAKWGHGRDLLDALEDEPGDLCSDCQLRLVA